MFDEASLLEEELLLPSGTSLLQQHQPHTRGRAGVDDTKVAPQAGAQAHGRVVSRFHVDHPELEKERRQKGKGLRQPSLSGGEVLKKSNRPENTSYPPCDEELIGRSSFFKIYYQDSEQIRMAREDCEETSGGAYHYMDTHLLMNNNMAFNLGICFPQSYQDTDPLASDYCSLEQILKRYYRDVGARCESLRVLSKKRFWPHRHFGFRQPRMDFLIAGFARSGSTTVKANLQRLHRHVIMDDSLLSFNWPPLLRLQDVQQFREEVGKRSISTGTGKNLPSSPIAVAPLVGFKSEAFAFSRHVSLVCDAYPLLKLIFVVREPIEWLQSVFNYRVHLRCAREGLGSAGCPEGRQHSFLQIATGQLEFEDCGRRFGRYSEILADVFRVCGRERVLVVEFESLKNDPEAFFSRIHEFLGLPRSTTMFLEETSRSSRPRTPTSRGVGDGGHVGEDDHAEDAEGRFHNDDEQGQGQGASGTATTPTTALKQSNQHQFESRNEMDKLAYNFVIRNILCDDDSMKTDGEEDLEIYRILSDYFRDEYPKIAEIVRRDQGFVSEKLSNGPPERSKKHCHDFFTVNENGGKFKVNKNASWDT
ncbi:unnamed protein product [Amoebophrya sp. A25]|nr:unnamed protein product [Amoebophrya sp. A25]|eukprot:GSA25T00002942001.1